MIRQKYMPLYWQFLAWLDRGTARQDTWLCLLAGALNALAIAPVNFLPILLVTFPLFIRILDKCPLTRQAFWRTFLFFFAFHVAGLYWISAALFVDIQNNWWVLPFSLTGLPALLALYPALAVIMWHRMAWHGSARLIALIVLFSATEWVRGWLFTGYPWNAWGYAWIGVPQMMQAAALIGTYGLSCLTLIFACLPLFFARNMHDRFGRIFVGVFLAVMAVLVVWGGGRLQTPLPPSDTPYNVRIVQPNIAQTVKWDPEARLHNEDKLWQHSVEKTATTPDIIVWPETAIALVNTMDVRRLEDALDRQLPAKTILAAGVMEIELDADNKPEFFNRLSFYTHTGKRLATYDKTHLVPFGEFLPFQDYWPVKPVALANGNMTRGTGVQTLNVQGVPPVSPLICYEVIFPGAAVDSHDRPAWILNITNDAWYGNTSGPYQHLVISRTRAIEEGLPLIRAANTGISAVIDPFGRIVASLPLNAEGIIDHALPPGLHPTLFARFGNTLFFALLASLWLMAWGLQRSRKVSLPYVE